MTRVDQSFAEFRRNLAPGVGVQQQIAERITALTTFMQRRYGVGESFPIGSYARGTLVPPAKDVDVLFVLKSMRPPLQPADTVLRELQNSLAREYSLQTVRVQKHSIGIQFVDFAIDVVPAFGAYGVYEIPELDDANNLSLPSRWVESRPREHTARVVKLNESTSGVASALVATLKHAYRRDGFPVKSFHLESMALDAIEAQSPTANFAGSLEVLLRKLRERVPGQCADVTGKRLDNYLGNVAREGVANRFGSDARALAAAISADSIDLARKVVPGLP